LSGFSDLFFILNLQILWRVAANICLQDQLLFFSLQRSENKVFHAISRFEAHHKIELIS